jgi:hypothetical protein
VSLRGAYLRRANHNERPNERREASMESTVETQASIVERELAIAGRPETVWGRSSASSTAV